MAERYVVGFAGSDEVEWYDDKTEALHRLGGERGFVVRVDPGASEVERVVSNA